MKYTLVILTAILSQLVFGQDEFPNFLQGTWKMEGREIYEHWDKLTDKSLLGFSYKLNNGQMKVSEYLEIKQHDKLTIYTATVVNQNHGNAVDFKLTKTNNSFTFENPNHDFSKKIVYQKLSDTQIFVQVSDGNNNGFSYKMYKQNIEDTTTPNPNFDRALAEKLGGDEYGMKSYFFVILKKGTNTTADKELIGQSFRGHLDNINQLVEEKKLIVA